VFVAGLNSDLVRMLLDRDELYMQQDSFLVDIDDLTRSVTIYKSSRCSCHWSRRVS